MSNFVQTMARLIDGSEIPTHDEVTITAAGSTPAAAGASLSGQALTLQPASSTHPGIVSAIAQSFAGLKTFVAGIALQAKLAITGITNGANAIEVEQGRRIHYGGAAAHHISSDGTYTKITGAFWLPDLGFSIDGGGFSVQQPINSSAGSGSNAIRLTQGARIRGSNASGNDYLYSDGAGWLTPGDLELTTADEGIILKSANGTRYKLTVSNAGALVITAA